MQVKYLTMGLKGPWELKKLSLIEPHCTTTRRSFSLSFCGMYGEGCGFWSSSTSSSSQHFLPTIWPYCQIGGKWAPPFSLNSPSVPSKRRRLQRGTGSTGITVLYQTCLSPIAPFLTIGVLGKYSRGASEIRIKWALKRLKILHGYVCTRAGAKGRIYTPKNCPLPQSSLPSIMKLYLPSSVPFTQS